MEMRQHGAKGGKDGKGLKGAGRDRGQSGPRFPGIDQLVLDELTRILESGGCPCVQDFKPFLAAHFGADRLEKAWHFDQAAKESSVLTNLVQKEQALRQFLLSLKALCPVWAVRDAEKAFLASSFVRKRYDVKEWPSLMLGPSLALHPVLSELFWEFGDAQAKWQTFHTASARAEDGAEVAGRRLLAGAEALGQLFEYRVTTSDLGTGVIDFTREIDFDDFEQWLKKEKGVRLADSGVSFNKYKFGLIMGGMNGALAELHRLQERAEKVYLAKLSDRAEVEVEQEIQRLSQPTWDLQEEAADFRARWQQVARVRSAPDVAAQLVLWARQALQLRGEVPPWLKTLTLSFAQALQAQGPEEVVGSHAQGQESAACASPLEVAETIKSKLSQLPTEQILDLRALQKLERQILGPGGSMDSLLPGHGSFLSFLAQTTELRDAVEQRMCGPAAVGFGPGLQCLGAGALMAEADQLLKEMAQTSALLDSELLGQLEQRLNQRLGKQSHWAGQTSLAELFRSQVAGLQSLHATETPASLAFGSGWALRVRDVKAFQLLQQHALRILRMGGRGAMQWHFGASGAQQKGTQVLQSLGVAPHFGAGGAGTAPVLSGISVEATALAQLRRIPTGSSVPAATGDAESEHAGQAARAIRESERSPPAEMIYRIEEPQLSGHATVEQALYMLQSLDYLEDVEESLCWESLFAPSLGALDDFLCKQAEARQLEQWGLRFMIPSPPSLASTSLSPRFVRVPANPRTEDLRDAVAAGQAGRAAALLLALCVDDPLDLPALSFFVKDGLGVLKDRSTAPPVRVAAAFTVATLRALPPRLRADVGAEALLPCLKEEVGWEAACWEAAELCHCTPVLAALGAEWGVATWALPSAPRSWDLATGEADFLRALGRTHVGVDEVPTAEVGHPTPAEGQGPATHAEVKKEPAPPPKTPEPSAPAKPSAAGEVTLEEDQKYHILEEIRDGFCLNQSDAAQLQRNLGGALKRLGDDLYREQHHFVFELLQNGDDNTYPDGAVPCYMLLLCDNMLVALSNEVGFNQENVKSLCSVDSSTKPRQEDGAERIGKKGIGFKSVFKITDTPTIHSTGWHFRFDANLRVQGVDIKELGYIVPEAMPAEDMRFPSWTTEIRLPFKRGLRHEERGLLRQDFEALGGTLLLNLNKLRRLTLWNCPADQPLPSGEGVRPNEEVIASGCRNLRCMDLCLARPHPTPEGTVHWKLVRIFDGQVRDWFCVEGSFPFQAASDSRKVRIKLSFPLPVEVSSDAWLRQELVAQQTFCYLPLRNFGWRLVLHANFDVTASRNELHSNSPWNLRIKKLLPKLLATSAHILQQNLMLTPMAEGSCVLPHEALAQPLEMEGLTSEASERSICHVPYAFFLRFMPLQGDLGGGSSLSSDFFGGTENHIWQQLQSERCVLAADGRWLEPPRAFEAPSEVEMKKVIPQELLSEFHDGLCYLHSEFVGLSPATLRQLGVKTHESAFDVLFIVLQRMSQAARLTDVDFLRQSLALAYRLIYGSGAQDLSGMETANGRVRRLRTLRLLSLRRLGAEPAAAADAGLFLPDAAQGVPEELLHCLDLKIVTPALFDGDEGGLVRRLLMGMGLRGLTPAAVIADGVVPFVKEATAADADAVALCLAFVAKNRSCFPECEEICSRRGRGPKGFDRILRTSLRVPCTSPGSSETSLREVSSGPVVLGTQLHEALARESSGEVAEAHSVLAAAASAEGSCAACAGELQKAAGALGLPLQEIAEFLADYCGVTLGHFPVQARSDVLVAGLPEAAPPHLQEAMSQLAGDEELRQACVTVRDVASPDLESALRSGASDVHKLVVASYILELHRNMTATLSTPAKSVSAPSAISFHLSSVPWLPCADARRAKPTEARFLWESPSSGIRGTLAAELDSKVAVRNFLERNLSIVSERTVSCQEAFRKLLQELGARQLGAEDVLRLLTEWSESGMSESTEGEMTSAYESLYILQKHRRVAEVDDAFKLHQRPLIFVPEEPRLTKSSQKNKKMHGRWLSVQECCVMEDRKFSETMRRKLSELGAVRELELHYAIVLKEPLISFGVREWPTEEHRIHSIARAGRDKSLDHALRIANCLMGDLFRWLGPGQGRTTQVAELDRDTVEELRGLFAKHAALPTISSGWVTWPCPGPSEDTATEESQDVGMEVFLPSQRGGDNRGRAVLHPGLGRYFAKFEMLGMKRVDVAGETVSSPPQTDPATVTPPLEVKGDLDGTPLVESLRITMAYIQLWLHELHPPIYQAVDRRSDRLQQWSIREAEELVLGGRQLVAHLAAAAGVLYVRTGTRGMHLQHPLAFLIGNPAVLGLGDNQGAATAKALATEIAIRLVEATQPGNAAVNVMRQYGLCSEAPPSAVQLPWWFGKAPLALEEVESKTVASRRPAKPGEAERGALESEAFALGSGPPSPPKSAQADAQRADGGGMASGPVRGEHPSCSDAGGSPESGSDPSQALVAALRGAAELGDTADLWSQVARHAKQLQERGRAAGEALGQQESEGNPATAEDGEEDPWAEWARNRAAGIEAAAPQSEQQKEAPARPVAGSVPRSGPYTSSSSSGPSVAPGHQPKRDEASGARPAGGLPASATLAAEEAASLLEDLAKRPRSGRELASCAGRLRSLAEERLAHHVQLPLLQYLDVDSDALLDVPPDGFAVPTQGRLCEEDERQVASWGERWVFHYLKRKYADQPSVVVKWLNDEEEQFEFYDVAVRFPNGEQDCYEVKTTITGDNKPMEVSERQVLEAAKLKQSFNFVRVFGAGGAAPKMLLIPNPSSQWLQKASTGVQLLVKLP